MEIQVQSIGWLHNEDPKTVTLTIVPEGGVFPVKKIVDKKRYLSCRGDKKKLLDLIKEL